MEKTKRVIVRPRRDLPLTNVVHAVFYIPEENRYITFPSSSLSFPKVFDSENVKPLTKFELKDKFSSFEALYISHSSSLSEIERLQTKLQSYIESGKTIDPDSSLRFLHDSFLEGENDDELEESENEQLGLLVSTSQNSLEISDKLLGKNCCQNQILNKISCQNEILDKISSQLSQNNRTLARIANDAERSRKTLTKILHKSSSTVPHVPTETTAVPAGVSEEEDTGQLEPVMYEGKDLVTRGKRNLTLVGYGLALARHLWTDEELLAGRLLPKKKTGRPRLSADKSELWKKAVMTRFRIIDEDDLRAAVTAVNQLGVDLKAGKRQRLG